MNEEEFVRKLGESFEMDKIKREAIDLTLKLHKEGKDNTPEFKEAIRKVSSVTLSDGTVVDGVKFTNDVAETLEKKGIVFTDALDKNAREMYEDDDTMNDLNKFLEEEKRKYKESNLGRNMFNLANLEATKRFCRIAPNIHQMRARADFFERRLVFLEETNLYRFKEELIKILIEKNKNEIGFRHLPKNNMFLEVFFEEQGITINGIHLIKVMLNPDTGEQYYIVNDDKVVPPNFTKEAISVFYTGLDKKKVAFFDYFLLDKNQMKESEELKKKAKYSCFRCGLPMENLTKNEIVCSSETCRFKYFGGFKVIYDLRQEKVKNLFSTQYMKDTYKVEDYIRLFVCNFLDFYNNREVIIRPWLSEEDRAKQNESRKKRGKSYMPPIRLINVTGHLYKYVSQIKSDNDGDIERIKTLQWVDGHYMRFWDREKYHLLYGFLKGCKGHEEIENKLKKLIRKDEDDHPMPESQQYEWDRAYEVIRVWKRPFYKNKEEGVVDERPTVKVIGK